MESLYFNGNYDEAIQYLKEALLPETKTIWKRLTYLGDIAYKEENWSEAAQWYQRLTTQDNLDLLYDWRLR